MRRTFSCAFLLGADALSVRSGVLDQLKTRFAVMVTQAGYEEIAAKIDQQSIADQLIRLEPEIIAKY